MSTTVKVDAQDLPKDEELIKPFKSQVVKRPIRINSRAYSGEWSRTLDDMGFDNITDEPERLEERLKWDIAHNQFELLKRCVSVTGNYNKEKTALPYEIDLYGTRDVRRHGNLLVTLGDYYMFYLKMDKAKRKDALISRIAISNVGLLLPYITLGVITLGVDGQTVYTTYSIKI